MKTAASTSVSKVIENGVALMIAAPREIARAVYADWMLAPEDKSLVEMLADCSRYLRAQEAKAKSGHWTYDFNRHVALRQAEAALLALIADEPSIEHREAA